MLKVQISFAPKGCTFRERFGDGVGVSGSVSQTGSVRIRSVGAPAVGYRRYYKKQVTGAFRGGGSEGFR